MKKADRRSLETRRAQQVKVNKNPAVYYCTLGYPYKKVYFPKGKPFASEHEEANFRLWLRDKIENDAVIKKLDARIKALNNDSPYYYGQCKNLHDSMRHRQQYLHREFALRAVNDFNSVRRDIKVWLTIKKMTNDKTNVLGGKWRF